MNNTEFLDEWAELLIADAKNSRNNAFYLGNTSVGAALLTDEYKIFSGCNVNHKFRCDDIHAEINAIGSMINAGEIKILAMVVVAERDKFTPCGRCMDWIFQFGGKDVIILYCDLRNNNISTYTANELMPHYPH